MSEAQKKSLSWSATEETSQKTPDWFWTIVLISTVVAVAALLVHNWLFAILVLLGGFSLILGGMKKPKAGHYAITQEGVVVNRQLFTYNNLTSFWIEEEEGPHMLILEVKNSLIRRLWIPLGEMDSRVLRTALAAHIPQERYEKSLTEIMSDRIGI